MTDKLINNPQYLSLVMDSVKTSGRRKALVTLAKRKGLTLQAAKEYQAKRIVESLINKK